MAAKQLRFLLILFYLGIWVACNRVKPVDPPAADLLEQTSSPRLYAGWKQWKRLITDSGTLSGRFLNHPDTLFRLLGNEEAVMGFYRRWMQSGGPVALVKWEERIKSHGLDPEYYHISYIRQCALRISRKKWGGDAGIPYDSLSLMTMLAADGILGIYHDLAGGRTDPAHTGAIYKLRRRYEPGLDKVLLEKNPVKALEQAEPDWQEYKALQKELNRLREFPDSLLGKEIFAEKAIRPGDQASVALLQALSRKLRLRGYLKIHDTIIGSFRTYNDTLSAAVIRFQQDMGLKDDGRLGPQTLGQLNMTRLQMLEALKGSLERWRWLGPVSHANMVWVNIAANRLFAWRNDSLILTMRTCSGEPRGPWYYEKLKASQKPGSKVLPPDILETPNFNARITHFVVNPTWYVPRNIVIKEMLPEIRNNPEILHKLGYIVKDSRGEEIDPHSINWWKVTPGRVNFTIEQTTGVVNSLGLVVIHFPNPFSIFMHDTPAKWVFGLDDRHVSHGCVRLEKPFDLVEFLTSFNRKDNFDKALIAAGLPPRRDTAVLRKWKAAEKKRIDTTGVFKPVQDKYFHLDSALPVYLVYFTAWENTSGKIEYTRDAYHRDQRMVTEMKRPGRRRHAYGKK